MCCFSRAATVADTNIFARSSANGRQFVAYSMTFGAPEDLAMILPIPVPRNSKDDAVKFINMEKYPYFFYDLRNGFPQRRPNMGFGGMGGYGGVPGGNAAPLKVEQVGAFEASFVPTTKDFGRLDERFRLPADTWDKLPRYKDYGFAVFKLKKGESQRIHPMAFEFPRADKRRLFFPTVHIHDGKVHARASFDHALYTQPDYMLIGWKESPRPASMFAKASQSQGLLDGRRHVYLREMRGIYKNDDILV
jgi:hypothetical protein